MKSMNVKEKIERGTYLSTHSSLIRVEEEILYIFFTKFLYAMILICNIIQTNKRVTL